MSGRPIEVGYGASRMGRRSREAKIATVIKELRRARHRTRTSSVLPLVPQSISAPAMVSVRELSHSSIETGRLID
jgi:hypothetical protein